MRGIGILASTMLAVHLVGWALRGFAVDGAYITRGEQDLLAFDNLTQHMKVPEKLP